MERTLRLLFTLHGMVTAAAGVVLFLAPGAIPGAVGVDVVDDGRLLPFMLGAAELAVAVLSFGGARLTDRRAVRLVVWTLMAFHLLTAAAEIYAFILGGISAGIWANVVFRVLVSALFAGVGLRSPRPRVGSPPARR